MSLKQAGKWSGEACIALALCAALIAPCAVAASPRERLAQGQQLYDTGDYEGALEQFKLAERTAAPNTPPPAETLHNQAAAHFKLGHLDEARELWVRTLGQADPLLEARARYNLGNCAYQTALQTLNAPEPSGVMGLLDRAMAHYADAIRLDPSLDNARANLQLAHQLKQQLQEQEDQQEQQQPQTQPSDEQQQQQDGQQQQQQQDGQPESQPSEQPQQQEQQPATQPSEPQQDRQQPPEPTTQPRQQPQQQEQPEPQPSDPQQQQSAQAEPIPIQMTEEEAERLLQMIRDAEKSRREVLRQREAARHKPVERDW